MRVGTGPTPEEWTDRLFLFASGGRGSGKTKGGGYRAAHYVMGNPRSYGTVTAPIYTQVHDATMPTLIDCLTACGFVQGYHFEYVATRESLEFHDGSIIRLRTTEHPQRLRGPDNAWFWMDEPRDSPFEAFSNLQMSLRQQGFPHQGWATSTPIGRMHWTTKIWAPEEALYAEGEEPMRPGIGTFKLYRAKTLENPFGGPELHAQGIQLWGEDSPYARQELYGEFVVTQGLVYFKWNPHKYVVPEDQWPTRQPKRVVCGVDFGFSNPSAMLVEGLDEAGRRYLLDEFYQTHMSEQGLVDAAWALKRKWNIEYFACLADGTLVHTPAGDRPIERIKTGDQVLTRVGWRKVTRHVATLDQPVYRLEFADGREMTATGNHPIWVVGIGWMAVESMKELLDDGKTVEVHAWTGDLLPITHGRSGLRTSDLFQRDTKYTTSTEISPTMILPTSCACREVPISLSTTGKEPTPSNWPVSTNGMAPPKAEPGTALLPAVWLQSEHTNVNAITADGRTPLGASVVDTVVTVAGRRLVVSLEAVEKCANANSAGPASPSAKMLLPGLAHLRVATISPLAEKCCVHDLTVEGAHEFFANGVAVHNCDTEDPRWIRAFRAAGLPALNARKRIGSVRNPSSGIGLCHWAMTREENDQPQFFVSPRLRQFQLEIEGYVLEDPRENLNVVERPRQHRNHLMDSWRYAEELIARLWNRPPGSGILHTIRTRLGDSVEGVVSRTDRTAQRAVRGK